MLGPHPLHRTHLRSRTRAPAARILETSYPFPTDGLIVHEGGLVAALFEGLQEFADIVIRGAWPSWVTD